MMGNVLINKIDDALSETASKEAVIKPLGSMPVVPGNKRVYLS